MENSASSSGSVNVSSNVCHAPVVCNCGSESKLIISWSDDNPGRRSFYGKYNASGRKCKYFSCYDPPTNDFHANLFNKIKKEIKELKATLDAHNQYAIDNVAATSLLSSVGYESIGELQNDIENLKIEVAVQKVELDIKHLQLESKE
ncbi:hypothetical protein AAZX31_05G087600 [Glycine max]|uniref:Uncharacterized protein n=2 Tax=Glycine subgen. Soja TaxID=1462606 RepID=A0A0R0K058_SOYBN|nr:hypothetical protein JHK87_012284 [Glycine soja]KAH1133571.1 hypothetical protein GYH30_012109 [Glycine max]KAH1249699.1 hypothetical protein GmHk_05G013005 [Glycine max]RZC11714.1 hypothetical protein D0Y65_011772 [Glycine soja]